MRCAAKTADCSEGCCNGRAAQRPLRRRRRWRLRLRLRSRKGAATPGPPRRLPCGCSHDELDELDGERRRRRLLRGPGDASKRPPARRPGRRSPATPGALATAGGCGRRTGGAAASRRRLRPADTRALQPRWLGLRRRRGRRLELRSAPRLSGSSRLGPDIPGRRPAWAPVVGWGRGGGPRSPAATAAAAAAMPKWRCRRWRIARARHWA